ncbi:hypothetical protein ASG49_13810 [Marmoricola sp. Leaf446]|uniref:MFS transporter n=1 Tax=Marmoricola sp. Leaf446 TaxID=1736379 RepID=UPI0006F640F6|nr:MFS transporter [Marmoricola sp. Leaf446]KQT90811.1 hypothetical protein ASG49_13810 [Marmoricola sp. Leaf446]
MTSGLAHRDLAARGAGAVRGALLAAYCALVVVTQLLWLSFSPVMAEAATALGVGAGAVGDLTVVTPLVFVVLATPAGRWLDRALVPALTAGAAATALGAVVRAVAPDSYGVVLAGQVLLSVGQPLVVGATTAMAAAYAPARLRTGVVAAASASQFVGILVAALGVGPLVAGAGFGGALRAQAVVAVIVALVLVGLLRSLPWPAAAEIPAARGGRVWRDRAVAALAVVVLVGVGTFNAVATWLDALLDRMGHPGVAGGVIALMTAVGLVASAVVPVLVARWDRRREYLALAAAVVVVGLGLAALTGSAGTLAVALVVVGAVLLPGLPVALDWAQERCGPSYAARTTSALLLAGNLGGVLLVLAVQPALGHPRVALLVLALLALPAVLAALTLPGRRPR